MFKYTIKEKKDFKKFLMSFGINKGDKVMITSSILPVLINNKKKISSIKPSDIIEILIEIVGVEGTLLFPVFNWDFCAGKDFDYKNTKSLSGSLGNLALENRKFKRSKNPIYSFAVFGKDKEQICKMEHSDCFSKKSPFGYMIKNKGKHLFIGIKYTGGFTPAHVAEQEANVKYRYFKFFQGNYIKDNKKIKKKIKMYVRKLDLKVMTGIHSNFEKILEKNNSFKSEKYKGIIFNLIDSQKAHTLMVKDIKNSGGMIYPKKIK